MSLNRVVNIKTQQWGIRGVEKIAHSHTHTHTEKAMKWIQRHGQLPFELAQAAQDETFHSFQEWTMNWAAPSQATYKWGDYVCHCESKAKSVSVRHIRNGAVWSTRLRSIAARDIGCRAWMSSALTDGDMLGEDIKHLGFSACASVKSTKQVQNNRQVCSACITKKPTLFSVEMRAINIILVFNNQQQQPIPSPRTTTTKRCGHVRSG